MSCALLSIGTELTRGELVNRNATWLADRLVGLGHEVTEIVTVDDDDGRIVAALERLSQGHRAVIATGGLGPTTDDRTTACAARLLGVPLRRDPESLSTIEARLSVRGRPLNDGNRKQADFPETSHILPNALGTAPGFWMEKSGCRLFFLPGVPSEMRGMFERSVVAALPAPEGRMLVERFRTFGIAESELGERVSPLEDKYGVTLGYRASHAEIEIKILLRATAEESDELARTRMRQVQAALRDELGPALYSEGTDALPAVLGSLLEKRGLTLGLAESCTGGLVSHLITSSPGASAYYKGSVCSYANSVKEGVLGVLPKTLEVHGAVSFEVAREMAIGAQRVLGADVTLALTGVAGPGGGTSDKPVGSVYWAVARQGEVVCHRDLFSGEREQIQKRAALAGLWSVRRTLLDPS